VSDTASTFEEHRERLRRLAYGMLGDISRTEDTVQDAYLRWQRVDPETVNDLEAYLSTIVTRLWGDPRGGQASRLGARPLAQMMILHLGAG